MSNPANPFTSLTDDVLITRLRRDADMTPIVRRQLFHAAADRITELADIVDQMKDADAKRAANVNTTVKRKA